MATRRLNEETGEYEVYEEAPNTNRGIAPRAVPIQGIDPYADVIAAARERNGRGFDPATGVTNPAPGAPPPAAAAAPPTATRQGKARPTTDPRTFMQTYMAQNAYTPGGYDALYKAMEDAGYDVFRPTHAGGTKLSSDKIGIGGNGNIGRVLDVVTNVGGPNSNWGMSDSGLWDIAAGKAIPGPGEGMQGGARGLSLGTMSGLFKSLLGGRSPENQAAIDLMGEPSVAKQALDTSPSGLRAIMERAAQEAPTVKEKMGNGVPQAVAQAAPSEGGALSWARLPAAVQSALRSLSGQAAPVGQSMVDREAILSLLGR